jgi:hypothetical protein
VADSRAYALSAATLDDAHSVVADKSGLTSAVQFTIGALRTYLGIAGVVGTSNNAAAYAALTPGLYRAARGVTLFSSATTIPAGVVVRFPVGSYPKFADGIVPTIHGRLQFDGMEGGPALPGGRMGWIGDSRSAAGAASDSLAATSLWLWLGAGSDGVVVPDPRYGMAVGGTTTAALDGQITNLLAAGTPAACGILTGTNDNDAFAGSGNSVASAVQISRIVSAWCRLLSWGILPIHLADLPRGAATAYSAALKARNAGTNSGLLRLAPKFGAFYYDMARIMSSAGTDGEPYPNETYDLIHPSPYGAAALMASFAGPDLKSRYPGFYGFDRDFDASAGYDATLSPAATAQLVQNPTFKGSGGSVLFGSITGTIATGVGIWHSGTSTGTASTVARSAPLYSQMWQQLSIPAPSSGTEEYRVYVYCTPNPAPRGSRMQMAVDVNLTGAVNGSSDVLTVEAVYNPTAGRLAVVGEVPASQGGFAGPYGGRMILPTHIVPSDATDWYVIVRYVVVAGGSTRVLQVGSPSARVTA